MAASLHALIDSLELNKVVTSQKWSADHQGLLQVTARLAEIAQLCCKLPSMATAMDDKARTHISGTVTAPHPSTPTTTTITTTTVTVPKIGSPKAVAGIKAALQRGMDLPDSAISLLPSEFVEALRTFKVGERQLYTDTGRHHHRHHHHHHHHHPHPHHHHHHYHGVGVYLPHPLQGGQVHGQG